MSFSILQTLEAATESLTVRDVARIFNISQKTIYRLANEPAPRGIPCNRLGAALRFDPLTLIYWIESKDPRFRLAKKAAERAAA